jgi:hypothetical protein
MASGALIGALRVVLGLDSAHFETGLKKAQVGLAGFGKVAGVGLAAVATAAAAASVALGVATKKAIDHADALGKVAQKIGVSVEALSRLEYAAKLSDVSLDGLSTGLRKLSQNMAVIAQGGKGPAAVAFEALGIAATDATGRLRASDEVLADVADKFARMEDGSTKTALALGIFGKSGTDLIPLLNEGKAGLKGYADEADRLGITIKTNTARNAEIFNDNLTRVAAAAQGVVNVVTEAALPTLAYLSQAFIDATSDGVALQAFANGFVQTVKLVVSTVAVGVTALQALGEAFQTVLMAGAIAQTGLQNWGLSVDILKNGFAEIGENIAGTIQFVNGLWAAVDAGTGTGGAGEGGGPLDPIITGAKKATEAINPLEARLSELSGILTATHDPFEQMKLDLTDLKTMLDSGAIGADQFGMAVQKTIAGATGEFAGLAGDALGALSQIFEGNKELAVASAIVNGIGSIAKTLETYGVTPWGIAAASIAGLTAAANVASILSTTSTSKSMPSTSAPSASVSTPQQATPQQAVNVTLNGQSYGRDQIRELLQQIGEYTADGSEIRVMT